MELAQYCVNAVLVEGRSVRAVAAATGRSKSWVQRHVSLYREGGDQALVPLRRGPKVPANLTSAVLEDKIVGWRKRLAEDGLDAGARTIAWHLEPRREPRCLRSRPFTGCCGAVALSPPSPKSDLARAGSVSSQTCPTRRGSPT